MPVQNLRWIGVRVVICLVIALFVATEIDVVYQAQGWSGKQTDFYGTVWKPNHEVLAGRSPYSPLPDPRPLSVYPPSGFLPFVALAGLRPAVAVVIFQVMLLAASMLTLIALRVRSPEKWMLWLCSPLVVLPVLGGNITPFVVLAVALMWRWRDRAPLAAAALTVGIAIKLFVAPLVVWLVMTRRYRAAAVTAIAAPLVIGLPWALIGFRGMREYPEVLHAASRAWGGDGALVQGSHGNSVRAQAHHSSSASPSPVCSSC